MNRHEKNLRAGAILWVLSLQYFLVQLLAAMAWTNPGYSRRTNTISDLGNTACGQFGARYVCSPLHMHMDLSLVLLGLTMIGGTFLLGAYPGKRRGVAPGFYCLLLAGLGTLLVGLFPENTVGSLHILGAALAFVLGNIGMLILGGSLKLPEWLRVYTIASGALGLAALVLFLTHSYLGLGIGGVERLVAYPQTIWMVVFGGYVLLKHR